MEPEKHLSDNFLFFNEPHPSGNVGIACNWDGQGNQLYKLMANNFTSEVSSFFLKNQQNTTILSKPSSDPNVGNATAGRKYRMRIKMFKTSDRRTPTRAIGSTVGDAYYQPQFSFNERENFTMYSRPSADRDWETF